MEIQKFIENFAGALSETEASELSASTEFRDLDEWSSLTAVSIIAMVENEYNTELTNADIHRANTIGDIFDTVKGKIK